MAEMEFIHNYTKDDYIKNHLKDYTFIVKQGDTLQPIWHVDLNYNNAENIFKLMKEKQNRTYTLIAILEGDYARDDAGIIIPSKYHTYHKRSKRTKEEKLIYYKRLCEYINIEY